LVATRSEAVARHLLDTVRDKELCERIKRELKDLVLVCFCVPAACHAQTLADIADGRIVS
jgi:tryptophan synthase alpha subunit